MNTKEQVAKNELNLRHENGMTSDEFIKRYCKIFREHAYATPDDSLNEFEKLIVHVLSQYVYCKRFLEINGFDQDPRYFVWAYDDLEETTVQNAKAILIKKVLSQLD